MDRQRRRQRVRAEDLESQVAGIGEGIIILLHFFINGFLEFPGVSELQRATFTVLDINGVSHLAVRGIHRIAFDQCVRIGIADQVGAFEHGAQADSSALNIRIGQRLLQQRIRTVNSELQPAQVRPFRRVQRNLQVEGTRFQGICHRQSAAIRCIRGERFHLLHGIFDIARQILPGCTPGRSFHRLRFADRFAVPLQNQLNGFRAGLPAVVNRFPHHLGGL